jgi:hypothetical protein
MDIYNNFDKLIWAIVGAMSILLMSLLSWVGLNIANKVEIMSHSVIELNSTMKNVVLQIDENKGNLIKNYEKINELDRRLLILENNK